MDKAFPIFFLLSMNSKKPVMIRVKNLPANTPDHAKIYFASSINNWQPDDPDFELKKDKQGYYILTLPKISHSIEYKYTLGSWDSVETDENGDTIQNRVLNPDSLLVEDNIKGWADSLPELSTAQNNVHILNEKFYIPQLKRYRRIWIYLPPDYETSDKKYSVIYMQDGQNLFDQSTSFSGEWDVDETLNQLFFEGKYDAIVVGIDNGGETRVDEYSPWINETFHKGGEGDAYVDFLANTLKPYIDTHYRTKKDAKNTGLFGSSLGALISVYGGLKYPDIFSKIGAFSPAFWYSSDQLNEYILTDQKNLKNLKFYFLAGTHESDTLITEIDKVCQNLLKKGVPEKNIYKKIDDYGTHTESYWSEEFGNAYEWLFND